MDFIRQVHGADGLADSVALQLRKELAANGRVVVRCPGELPAADFESIATASCGRLEQDNGEHDRTEQGQEAGVFTPTSYSPRQKLLWHNENSFLDVFPGCIVFGSVKVPKEGGETPLVDNERLMAAIDRGIVRRFREHGIRYVRTYHAGLHRTWQQILQASTKDEAEAYGREHGIELHWQEETLTTVATRPAFCTHPESGRETFFAQPLHWHPRALPGSTREVLDRMYGTDNLPRHCVFGDGTEIDDSIIDELIQACEELEEVSPWAPGKVMVVDNIRYAHGRNPYKGERELFVAMGKMYRQDPTWSGGSALLHPL